MNENVAHIEHVDTPDGPLIVIADAADRVLAAGWSRDELAVARRVVPFIWQQLCTSGPLAAWEYAARVLGIALAHARGVSYDEAVEMSAALCEERRPASVR